ncbi:MAG: hypothetical protein HKN21_12655 [Candidatus Eisenbacteria bacterium]|uniref:Uncharacterized protein n=1 Tax=Eiseniibacteriota bacterium TaxID=2212470 RepID=A0A7Y2ECR7_UNCEI|nr:hypothetical protein [Candidatus Eisenbacteria bacterium]
MITNEDQPEVQERIAGFDEPLEKALLSAVRAHKNPFAVVRKGIDLEFLAKEPVQDRANRAMIKLFTVTDGPLRGRAAMFFYKKSQIPFSRDRFSYGAVVLPKDNLENDVFEPLLQFASKGFTPELRPKDLRRALTFTVPD